jgi:hypothetical protein
MHTAPSIRAGCAALPSCSPDPDRNSPGAFHCPTCEPKEPRAKRLQMRCGFLPREEWPAGSEKRLPTAFASGALPYTSDVCPGWLVRQPAVIEAAQAYAALEAGILDRFDPTGLRVVTQAALEAKRAFNLHELERQKKLAQRVR